MLYLQAKIKIEWRGFMEWFFDLHSWNIFKSLVSFITFALLIAIASRIKSQEIEIEGRNLEYWQMKLRSGNKEERIKASFAISLMGRSAEKALLEISDGLKSSDWSVRHNCLCALYMMDGLPQSVLEDVASSLRIKDVHQSLDGFILVFDPETVLAKNGEASISTLTKLLRSGDECLERAACISLGLMSDSAMNAVPELSRLLDSMNVLVSNEVLRSIRHIGKPALSASHQINQFMKRQDLDDPFELKMFQDANDALISIGADPPAFFRDLLKDNNPERKLLALHMLSRYGAKNATWIKDIRSLLSEPNKPDYDLYFSFKNHFKRLYEPTLVIESVNFAAAFLISQIDSSDKSFREFVARGLSSDDELERIAFAYLLADAKCPSAIPMLWKMLTSENSDSRIAASFALLHQGAERKKLVTIFSECLMRKMREIRRNQMDRIVRGQELDRDRDYEVVNEICKILGNVGPEASESLSELVKIMIDIPSDCDNTLRQIMRIEPNGAHAVQGLVAILKSPSIGRKDMMEHLHHVLMRLGQFGPRAVIAKDSLSRIALTSNYDDIRCEAVESLGWIGSSASSEIPKLKTLLVPMGNKPTQLQEMVFLSIGRIGSRDQDVLSLIREYLKTHRHDASITILRGAALMDQCGINAIQDRLNGDFISYENRAILSGALGIVSSEAIGLSLSAIAHIEWKSQGYDDYRDFADDVQIRERKIQEHVSYLERFGVGAGSASPILIKLADDEDPLVRISAIRAIGVVSGKALVGPSKSLPIISER